MKFFLVFILAIGFLASYETSYAAHYSSRSEDLNDDFSITFNGPYYSFMIPGDWHQYRTNLHPSSDLSRFCIGLSTDLFVSSTDSNSLSNSVSIIDSNERKEDISQGIFVEQITCRRSDVKQRPLGRDRGKFKTLIDGNVLISEPRFKFAGLVSKISADDSDPSGVCKLFGYNFWVSGHSNNQTVKSRDRLVKIDSQGFTTGLQTKVHDVYRIKKIVCTNKAPELIQKTKAFLDEESNSKTVD